MYDVDIVDICILGINCHFADKDLKSITKSPFLSL